VTPPDKLHGAEKPRLVSCPQCGKSTPWSADNAFRPFCSERCKLIDFGQWASEGYRVPLEQGESERNDEP
jgi:uncharacterized protein